jgi:hypothetical protein
MGGTTPNAFVGQYNNIYKKNEKKNDFVGQYNKQLAQH